MNSLTARCTAANEVLAAIAGAGRRFFYSPAYERTARFDLDHVGQVWLIDHHTGLKLHPLAGRWTGFTGATLAKALVYALSEFIETGRQVPFSHFQNDWGYGAAMAEVIVAVLQTGAVAEQA